jgi:flavorubredoxin
VETQIAEISDGIYRLSTCIGNGAEAFGFNQFLIKADEPLLFHCGHLAMFPTVSKAAEKILPLDKLRWISFGHFEGDECGSLNSWLSVAPHAVVRHSSVACMTSLNDFSQRQPVPFAVGEVLDLGGKRVRQIETPHFTHAWESQLIFEETTQTLFCADLGAHGGNGPAAITSDIVGPATAMEDHFRSSSLTPTTASTIRDLAALSPATLALMHGSSFSGDCKHQLLGLAEYYQNAFNAACKTKAQ